MKQIYSLAIVDHKNNKLAKSDKMMTIKEARNKIFDLVCHKLPESTDVILMKNGKIFRPSYWQHLKNIINENTGKSLFTEINN